MTVYISYTYLLSTFIIQKLQIKRVIMNFLNRYYVNKSVLSVDRDRRHIGKMHHVIVFDESERLTFENSSYCMHHKGKVYF